MTLFGPRLPPSTLSFSADTLSLPMRLTPLELTMRVITLFCGYRLMFVWQFRGVSALYPRVSVAIDSHLDSHIKV
jgi:hypothetical protein